MKTRAKKRPKKTRRKGIYVLPNLFTSASLFGGFYAIVAAINGRYEAAAIAIIISGLLDGLDGRIARFTQATSHFGIEYDSLSDLVAFGVAPGVLTFMWGLKAFGRLGWLAAFVYVICGALRLARFNVKKNSLAANHFQGLPIPAAACFLASLILFTSEVEATSLNSSMLIIFMMYGLSFLMVSTISYLSFKELDLRKRKPFNALVSIILVFILVAYKPQIILFFILLCYVLSGPFITLYRLHGRRSQAVESLDTLSPTVNPGDTREMGDQGKTA
jgi:CDP-diacylglycerol--serine O-phosphatidyltransferase